MIALPRRRFRAADRVFAAAVGGVAALFVAALGALGWMLWLYAAPVWERLGLWRFLLSREWNPVTEEFGALPFIYGTVVSSLLALLIAAPTALGIAIFLTELAPGWLRQPVAFLVDLLAAIPSVVYGLWGIFVLVPWVRTVLQPALASALGFLPLFQGPAIGFGLLAAGLVLAIMILPTIAAVTREVLASVPDSQREAVLALGATRWEMIRHGVLPSARPGILGAIILGLGRAVGETMAVTMVIGNRPEIRPSLFAPAYSMASVIANEFAEATGDAHVGALVAVGFLLFAVTFLLNILARLLVRRGRPGGGKP